MAEDAQAYDDSHTEEWDQQYSASLEGQDDQYAERLRCYDRYLIIVWLSLF